MAEATEAPDKRLQAGAVPAAGTNNDPLLESYCPFCARGEKVIKMRRQYVHFINRRIVICTAGGIIR